MIHIIEIDVPNKKHWGSVITKDIVLPSKIHRIRGILGNVLIGDSTYFERLYSRVYSSSSQSVVYSVESPISVQIGTFSLTLNNSTIICANTPLCAIAELHKSGYKHNLSSIDNINVEMGSMARVLIEEKHLSPFIDDEYFETIDSTTRDQIKTAYFGSTTVPTLTNSYKVKIYIDYD